MITLLPKDKLHAVKGFKPLLNLSDTLKVGDLICYGEAPQPTLVKGSSILSDNGFVVLSWEGYEIDYAFRKIADYFRRNGNPWGGNLYISFWTKSKEYFPGKLAEPLPLP